jgi:hypothetical protein
MFMRVTMGRIRAGCWSQFEAAYQQHIERAAVPGLRARWLVRSVSDADIFFTISLWDALAEMESFERSDAVKRRILPYIAQHLSGISTAHHCEVRQGLPVGATELAAMFQSVNAR